MNHRTHASVSGFAYRAITTLALGAALLVCAAGPWASTARAQGSRKDDVVFNSRGQPLAGAQVRVCTSTATTTSPCSPLASVYSDPALSQALANPFTTDGMGNYNFYSAPGRYVIEISGPGITTRQMRDIIVPNDPASPTFASITTTTGINAFTLSLSGNLTVAGSAAVTGALTVGGAPVPSVNQANTWTAQQQFNVSTTFKGPSPWHDITAYGAPTNGTSDAGPAFSAAWLAANADPGGTIFIPPNPNGFLINTCPAVPSATTGSGFHVRILQAATVTFGSGCPTWNIANFTSGGNQGVQNVTWEGWGGGSGQNADSNGPTATIISNNNATLFNPVVEQGLTFRNLDIRCGSSSLAHPCIQMANNGTGTGSGLTFDKTNVTVGNSTNSAALAFQVNGLPGAGAFQVLIEGGSWGIPQASSEVGNTAIQFIDAGNIAIRNAHLIGSVKLTNTGVAATPTSNYTFDNLLYEATKYAFILDAGSDGGAGIAGVTMINISDADAATAPTYFLESTGTNGIHNVTIIGLGFWGTTAPFLQTNPIDGLNLIGAEGNLTDTSAVVAGSAGCVISGGNGSTGCWGPTNSQPAFYISPGTISAGTPSTGFAGGTDAHHFYDSRNGGNGIAYTSLLGSGNGTIARFDSSGALSEITIEAADAAEGILFFPSPTHGSGLIAYNHASTNRQMVFGTDASTTNFVLYADARGNQAVGSAGFYGDVNIETGGSSANGIKLTAAPTAFRTQVFQDATGFIALTSQLPLVGTTSSIGGSALAAGACTTGTASVTGATTSMAVAVSPASDPGTGFTWTAWVSASGTVTARVCNVSGASATPTAAAYNVRVIQ